MLCKGRISAEPRGCLKATAGLCWDTLGLWVSGGAWLIPGSTRQQQMEEPSVIAAGVGAGRGGHDRRTKPRIYSCSPFTVSPSLPPCAGLFLHFLCFSCLLGHPGADTHTKSEPWASLSLCLSLCPSLCHQHCEPLGGPRSTVVPLIRLAERAQGQAGLGASCSAQPVAMAL